MAITIKDQESSAVRLPSAKWVDIGAIAQGEIEPSLKGDTLRWHACVKQIHPTGVRGAPLLQGFGHSPREAVADAIVSARRELAAFREYLAEVEKQCGTTECSDQEIIDKAKGCYE